ncbi:MAG: hypothetical protein V4558_02465 [Gemmatimonadota bacterium]
MPEIESPRLARLSRLPLLAIAAVAAALVLYVLARLAMGTVRTATPVLVLYLVVPLVVAILSTVVAGRSTEARLATLLTLALSLLAVWLFEVRLQLDDGTGPGTARAIRAAEAAGRSFDRRKGLELVDSIRAGGVAAFPAMFGPAIAAGRLGPLSLRFVVGRDTLLPLGSVPKATTVYCNESGTFDVYRTDSLGYNNDDATWSDSATDAVLLGDSYVAGACLPRERGLAAALREFGIRSLNLGVGGSGPLAELARLREFGAPRRPRLVLWLYTEGNDFEDLKLEERNPTLKRYLDPSFSQQLATRHAAMDTAFEHRLDSVLAEHRLVPSFWARLRGVAWADVVRLQTLRDNLRLPSLRTGERAEPRCCSYEKYDFATFEQVLREADREVKSWGGRLEFVVIPDNSHFLGADGRFCRPCTLSPYRDSLNAARHRGVAVARDAGLEVVDLHPALLAEASVVPLFDWAGAHFNAAGYHFIAKEVARQLRR